MMVLWENDEMCDIHLLFACPASLSCAFLTCHFAFGHGTKTYLKSLCKSPDMAN